MSDAGGIDNMNDLPVLNTILKSQAQSTLAKNLALARSACNVTQEQLAERAQLSRATIAQIEGGDADPKLSTIMELAIALGVSPVILLLDEQDLKALARVSNNMPKSNLSESQIEDMRRLIQSGITNKITKAVSIGVGAVAGLGLTTTGAMVGAAIGSVLMPGVASIVFAACLGTALSKKWASKSLENEQPLKHNDKNE